MSSNENPEMTEYLYSNFITPEVRRSFTGNAGVILFPALSCVRLFDASMIGKLANVYVPELFEHWEREDFGGLLREYIKSQLLVYERGYSIESTMRIMAEAYLKNHDEKRWRAVNEKALGTYREWLERPVDQRGLLVVEESYHMAKLGLSPKEIQRVFKERLKNYRDRYPELAERSEQIQVLDDWLSVDTDLEMFYPAVRRILMEEVKNPNWLEK